MVSGPLGQLCGSICTVTFGVKSGIIKHVHTMTVPGSTGMEVVTKGARELTQGVETTRSVDTRIFLVQDRLSIVEDAIDTCAADNKELCIHAAPMSDGTGKKWQFIPAIDRGNSAEG